MVRIFQAFSRIRTRSYFGPLFFPHSPAFGLNTERYSVYSVRMQENEGKMRTRITPNTDTFYAVYISYVNMLMIYLSPLVK